jgi:transcriptional regulator with XRE-family HTH domain
MSDDDVLKLLEESSRSEYDLPLTDSMVDAFLATPTECSEGAVDRMWSRFVEKALSNLHEVPVREVEDLPFGRWIEATRKRVGLTPQDIGAAIGKDQTFIEKIENGVTFPWNLSLPDVTNLVRLFRLHINAFMQLATSSLVLSRARVSGDVIGRSHGGKATQNRGESLRRSLDLYLAKNAKKEEPSDEITNLIGELRKNLERQQATDLLE